MQIKHNTMRNRNDSLLRVVKADCRTVRKELKRIWQHIRKFAKRTFKYSFRKIKHVLKVSWLGLKVLLKLTIQYMIRGLQFVDKRIKLKL